MNPHQLIEQFIADADVTEGSKRLYHYIIHKFFLWVADKNKEFNKLTRADIINYKTYLQASELSLPTIKNYFTIVRIFFTWASVNNYHDDIASGIRTPKNDNSFKKYPLTIDQVKKLLSLIDKTKESGARDYAIISILLNNGLRRNEVATLNIGDITTKHGNNGMFIQGKGRQGKDQFINMSESTLYAVHDYLLFRNDTSDAQPLFTSLSGATCGKRVSLKRLSEIVKQRLNSIGLTGKYYCCHSLRHTAATLLLESGEYDMHDVQVFMRHKSPSTTQQYTRVVEERKRLSNAPVLTLEKLLINNSKDITT